MGQYPLAPVTAITAATTNNTIPHPLVNPTTPAPITAPTVSTPRSTRSDVPTVFFMALSSVLRFSNFHCTDARRAVRDTKETHRYSATAGMPSAAAGERYHSGIDPLLIRY